MHGSDLTCFSDSFNPSGFVTLGRRNTNEAGAKNNTVDMENTIEKAIIVTTEKFRGKLEECMPNNLSS